MIANTKVRRTQHWRDSVQLHDYVQGDTGLGLGVNSSGSPLF